MADGKGPKYLPTSLLERRPASAICGRSRLPCVRPDHYMPTSDFGPAGHDSAAVDGFVGYIGGSSFGNSAVGPYSQSTNE